jgi:arginyl-tRNA synthetase
MNVEENIKESIRKAFHHLYQHSISEADLVLQPTRKDFEGSHTFVTFPLGKQLRKSPPEIAQAVGSYLKEQTSLFSQFNVVQGFLNLSIADRVWLDSFSQMLENRAFGTFPDNGQKVMVEYSSPNTNKPLHLGHLRNNFLGYSVAAILKANGYRVVKANLVNDRGIHICKSMLAYHKFGEGETPESAGMKGDHLVGKYYVRFDQEYKKEIEALKAQGKTEDEAKKQAPIILEAQDMLLKWEQGDEATVNLWNKMNGWVYEGFAQTYQTMGVDFDQTYKESQTYKLGKDVVEEGLRMGVFFRKPDGSVWINLAEEGLDEKLILRGDGTSVYITQDLGTADLKYQDFQLDKSVYVVGNEQDYHFAVLFAILKRLGRSYADGLFHLSYGMVDLPSGKMKSREGTVVDADELMDEMVETAEARTKELGKIEDFDSESAKELYRIIGLGALKYFLLKVDPKKRMLFNPEESVDFQGHTASFIQFNYARLSSVLRKAKQSGIVTTPDQFQSVAQLFSSERELIILLSDYPAKVAEAGRTYAPSVIAQYVYELAKAYGRVWTEVSILGETDENIRSFRVALSQLTAQTIRQGMSLLGIQVPERM